MVDRIGGGSSTTKLSDKPNKAPSQKRKSKAEISIGIQLESQLRALLKESNVDDGRSEILISTLIDAVFADKLISFEDKERIQLLVKDKISKHSTLMATFSSLLNQLGSGHTR